jgi:DNA polymerase-1
MRFKLPKHENTGTELLVLFDAMALAYRAYFAFIARPLVNAAGENTSAVYGFIMALLQFLEHHSPTHAAVCFDTAAPTFRHKMYAEYKANRERMPEDMVPQLAKIKEIVRAYNIPLVELDGYEADDVIGTLARKAEAAGIDSLLVTPDKDFCQLVTAKVKILRPAKEGREMEIFDEQAVRNKYGIEPIQIIDYLALVGDASDNIPGVRGVGEKTAAPLIAQYGSVEGIYKAISSIEKKGLREKLANEHANAILSLELATIDTKVPLPFSLDDLRYGNRPDYAQLEKLFLDQGFKSLTKKILQEQNQEANALDGDGADTNAATDDTSFPIQSAEDAAETQFDFALSSEESNIRNTPHAYVVVKTEKGLRALATMLGKQKEFAVDLESTSLDANSAEMIGISFCAKPGEAYYVPINIPERGIDMNDADLFATGNDSETPEANNSENAFSTGLAPTLVIEILKPVLENPKINKVGQNIKYDALLLRHHGVKVSPLSFDTMVGAYVLRAEGSHSMDSLALEHLHYRPVPLSDVVGQLKESTSRETMGLAPTTRLAEYGAEDSDVTLKLKQALLPKLKSEALLELCEEIDFPTVEVLTTVEFNGVKIDTEMLKIASKEMEREAENLCTKIYAAAGGPFNIDSTKQLADVLFNKLGLKQGKKTKTGFSTNAAVLDELRTEHPIAEDILNYRQYQKLRSTYVDALPQLVNAKTGMVHTSYNQAVVATGRISSTNPNLQNIPIRTEMGRDIRKAFVSRHKDGLIFSADYSQIELRIIAHITKDASLLEAFKNHEDIHTRTAASVFGVSLEEVNRDMRRKAKEVNYGIMYGIGAFGLARRLNIPQSEGSEIIKKYFQAFPTIKQYMEDTLTFAREKGYVQTLNGRRRYMKNILAANHAVRSAEERAAINMPIQGTAADMMKLAMINIQRELEKENMRSLMIMQVHDELVFDVVSEEKEKIREVVVPLMENAMPMIVAIEVEAGIGTSWYDAH